MKLIQCNRMIRSPARWMKNRGNEHHYQQTTKHEEIIMKQFILTAVLAIALSSLTFAAEPLPDNDQENALLTFLENTYEVIGRHPGSGRMYEGRVTLERKENKLVMTRRINGKKTVGTGRIVAATPDSIPVLQADFSEGKQKYRATYVIGSDLDNYARLTGKIFMAGKETKKSGMEALFILIKPDT